MQIANCDHLPDKFVEPRDTTCEGGDAHISLRVCLTCGHVGCCDDSPGKHVRKHAEETGHQVMASYPADENSFIWCYAHDDYLEPDEERNLASKIG